MPSTCGCTVMDRSDRIVDTYSDDCGNGRASSVIVFTSIGGNAGGPPAPFCAWPWSSEHAAAASETISPTTMSSSCIEIRVTSLRSDAEEPEDPNDT